MFKRAFVEKLVPAFYYWYHLNRIYFQHEDPNVLYSKGREFGRRFALMTNREKERYIQRLRDELISMQYQPILEDNDADFTFDEDEIQFLENL